MLGKQFIAASLFMNFEPVEREVTEILFFTLKMEIFLGS